MGMATNTGKKEQIAGEFKSLKLFYDKCCQLSTLNFELSNLSMGMSSDHLIAIDNGSTMVRIGSSIFGSR